MMMRRPYLSSALRMSPYLSKTPYSLQHVQIRDKMTYPSNFLDRPNQARAYKYLMSGMKFFRDRRGDITVPVQKFLQEKHPLPNMDKARCTRSIETFEDKEHGNFKVYTYLPKDQQVPENTVIFYHGGGWCVGNIERSYHELVDAMAGMMSTRFICIEYGLAPQYPFPTAINQCIEYTKYILSSGSLDPGKCAIMGDSAGGNFAMVVAAELVKENFPNLPKDVFLIYPWLQVADMTLDSIQSPISLSVGAPQQIRDFTLNYHPELESNAENAKLCDVVLSKQGEAETEVQRKFADFVHNPKVSPLFYGDDVISAIQESSMRFHFDIPEYCMLVTETMQMYHRLNANSKRVVATHRLLFGTGHGWTQFNCTHGGMLIGKWPEHDKLFEEMALHFKNTMNAH